jgi:putative flippase GtrA
MAAIFRQFVKFLGVGVISLIVHYCVLILLKSLGMPPVLASDAGFLLGGLVNYLLNWRFTFGGVQNHLQSGAKFATLVAIGLGLNSILMWIGVYHLGLHYLLSQVLTTGLLTVWNFFAHRYWTFRHPQQNQR